MRSPCWSAMPAILGVLWARPPASVGAEENDDASVALQAFEEIGDGVLRGDFRAQSRWTRSTAHFPRTSLGDGFAPAGERDGGAEVAVAAVSATDQDESPTRPGALSVPLVEVAAARFP